MSNSVRPHRRQPTRLHHPWDSPGKNTEVGCHFLLQCMKVTSLSHVRLFATPWTTAYRAPQSVGFSRQEYWSGVPLPSPCEYTSLSQIFCLTYAVPMTRTTSLLLDCLKILTFFEGRLFLARYLHFLEAV